MHTVHNRSRLLGGLVPEGVCSGGVSGPKGSGPRGVSASGGGAVPGGCLFPKGSVPGVPAPDGGGIPACTEPDPPPLDRQTGVKNITFATLLRTVKTCFVVLSLKFKHRSKMSQTGFNYWYASSLSYWMMCECPGLLHQIKKTSFF